MCLLKSMNEKKYVLCGRPGVQMTVSGSKQGVVPGGGTWRNLHMGGGLDLDFEGALEGQKASILAGMDGWTYSTATYQVPAGCGAVQAGPLGRFSGRGVRETGTVGGSFWKAFT